MAVLIFVEIELHHVAGKQVRGAWDVSQRRQSRLGAVYDSVSFTSRGTQARESRLESGSDVTAGVALSQG